MEHGRAQMTIPEQEAKPRAALAEISQPSQLPHAMQDLHPILSDHAAWAAGWSSGRGHGYSDHRPRQGTDCTDVCASSWPLPHLRGRAVRLLCAWCQQGQAAVQGPSHAEPLEEGLAPFCHKHAGRRSARAEHARSLSAKLSVLEPQQANGWRAGQLPNLQHPGDCT